MTSSSIMKLVIFFISCALVGNGSCYTHENNKTANRLPIIGGSKARIEEAPYFVQVLSSGSFCGGALLTRKHVLTARHCIQGSLTNLAGVTIFAGSDTLASREETRYAEQLYVLGGSEYDETYEGNDIAVIEVAQEFTGRNLATIELPSTRPEIGDQVLFYGMGKHYRDHRKVTSYLKKLPTTITPCTYAYSKDLCAKSADGHGICQGDSGSPLLNAKREVIGIASRLGDLGATCASQYPDYFVNVYDHKPFIMQIINGQSKSFNDRVKQLPGQTYSPHQIYQVPKQRFEPRAEPNTVPPSNYLQLFLQQLFGSTLQQPQRQYQYQYQYPNQYQYQYDYRPQYQIPVY